MWDRRVRVESVVAYTIWVVAVAILVVSWIVGSDDLGRLAVIVMGAGATLTVRSYFTDHDRKMQNMIVMVSQYRDRDRDDDSPIRPVP